MRITSTIPALACALGIIPLPAEAQSITGTIVGRVTDPSDAVIVGASVRAILKGSLRLASGLWGVQREPFSY